MCRKTDRPIDKQYMMKNQQTHIKQRMTEQQQTQRQAAYNETPTDSRTNRMLNMSKHQQTHRQTAYDETPTDKKTNSND